MCYEVIFLYYTKLYYTILYYTVLHIGLYRTTLYYTAPYYTTSHYIILHCTTPNYLLIRHQTPHTLTPQIIAAMLDMDMITSPEASVLLEMARAGNEYVTAAFELYQAGKYSAMCCEVICYAILCCAMLSTGIVRLVRNRWYCSHRGTHVLK